MPILPDPMRGLENYALRPRHPDLGVPFKAVRNITLMALAAGGGALFALNSLLFSTRSRRKKSPRR